MIAAEGLDDRSLVAAFADTGVRNSIAVAAEAGRRRLLAAIPALEAACRRFSGFGADRLVPEQAAALDALGAIGGRDAAQALVRLIAKGVVQGPGLQKAIATAAGLGARLPAGTVLELLRHRDPKVRADACRCAHRWPGTATLLCDLLDDLHAEVRKAAACALGRMGRSEIRALLMRYLRQDPSAELIDAVVPIADEECVVLLGRIARAAPDLAEAALDALGAADHPRAQKIEDDIRRSRPT